MGCLSVVNTATSAIFTEGAWESRADGKFELVWPAASEKAIKLVTGREGQDPGEGF